MEKFCPACGRVYADVDLAACEADGERLLVLQSEPDLVGRELDGKYLVKAKLGEGGMGSVYVAEQATMGREVAIKVLRPQFARNKLAIKRFLREARAASRLTHPNTITVYDSGQTPDGLLYQVMERLTGQPLSDIMERIGALPPERAIKVLSQVCDSLSEAHSQGITHRDLKPENIFIEPKVGNPDFVKVLDFGIAKMAEENVTQATATGMICGTPSYMSPEQAMGRELDGTSDIYALGVLLYEMLTCKRPFDGDTPMEVMLKHINAPVPVLPEGAAGDLHDRLEAVIQWMMAKKPADRPKDCQQVKDELQRVLGREPPSRRLQPLVAPPAERQSDPAATEKTGLSPAPGASVGASSWAARTGAPRRALVAGWIAAALVVGGLGAAWWFLAGPGAADGTPPAAALSAAAGREPAAPRLAAGEGAPAPEAALVPVDLAPDDVAAQAEPSPEPPADPEAPAGASAGAALAALPPTVAALTAPPEPVEIVLRTAPSGAEVTGADGAELGLTPVTIRRPPDAGPLEVDLALDGYRTRRVSLDPAAPPEAPFELDRASRRPLPARSARGAAAAATVRAPETAPEKSGTKAEDSTKKPAPAAGGDPAPGGGDGKKKQSFGTF